MDPSSIALQGMQQAEGQLEAAASLITGAGAPVNGAGVDVVSLSAEMVALMSAQTQFEVSAATLSAVDQMQQSLIDVTA